MNKARVAEAALGSPPFYFFFRKNSPEYVRRDKISAEILELSVGIGCRRDVRR